MTTTTTATPTRMPTRSSSRTSTRRTGRSSRRSPPSACSRRSGATSPTPGSSIPASDTQAQTNGFGVVFTDVDQAGATTIELPRRRGREPRHVAGAGEPRAASSSRSSGSSSIRASAPRRRRITTGTAALVAPPALEPGRRRRRHRRHGRLHLRRAAAGAARPEQPDVKGPELTLKGVPQELEMKAFTKGLKLKLTTDEPATIDASLRAKARSVEFAEDQRAAGREVARPRDR